MIKILNPEKETWEQILKRPTASFQDIEATARNIFREIESEGDEAVLKYTKLFDGVKLYNYKVEANEIQEAVAQVSSELKAAILIAKANIEKFHAAQKTTRIVVETTDGDRKSVV